MSREQPEAWEPLSGSESAFLCFNVSSTDTVCFSTLHLFSVLLSLLFLSLKNLIHRLILSLLLVFDTLAALSLPIESWTIEIVNNDYTRCPKFRLLFINFLFIVHAGRRVFI
jgi:hypothetical protein